MKLFVGYVMAAFLTSGMLRADLLWEPLNEPGSGGWLTSLRINPTNSSHLILGGDMLGIGTSHDSGASWTGGFGLSSWEIGDLTFHPENSKTVWAGTMSGPYVSYDGGHNWESKRQGLPEVAEGFYSAPIQRILIDPANTKRLLAFAGTYRGWSSPGSPKFGYIWESRDGGNSWTEFSSIRPYRSITWVDADRDWNRFYAVIQNQGIYTSVDKGKTWQPAHAGLPPKSNVRMVAVHPSKPLVAWTAAGNYPDPKNTGNILPGGIYQTVDGGKTWMRTGNGLPSLGGTNPNYCTRFQAIALSEVNPNCLVTSDTSWNKQAVYQSTDGGVNWTQVLTKDMYPRIPVAYPAGMGATVITFDPLREDTYYVANSETVLRTTDQGKTWRDITSSPTPSKKVPESIEPKMIVAEGVSVASDQATPDANTVLEVAPTEPSGPAWRGHGYSGLCSTKVVFNPFLKGSVVLTAMDAGKFLRSNDNLQSWFFYEKGFSQPWGGANDAAFAGDKGRIIYLATGQHGGEGAIARSNDGGITWREFYGESSGLPGRSEATSVHCEPDKPEHAWAVMGGNLYSTSDGGETWKRFSDIAEVTTIGKIEGRAFPFYVGFKQGVLVTRDGKSFELLPDSPSSPSSIRVHPSAPDAPFVVRHRTDDAGVFHWNGSSWSQIFKNSHAFDIAVHPHNPKRLAVATSDDPYHDASRATGVWISEDGGSNWKVANAGLSCLRGKAIAFDPHQPDRLIFGSFGRGFFQTTWVTETSNK
jgi:photosystem II stability/assembly factor-like uncharacterized protein